MTLDICKALESSSFISLVPVRDHQRLVLLEEDVEEAEEEEEKEKGKEWGKERGEKKKVGEEEERKEGKE